MFRFFRKKKLDELTERAAGYLAVHYERPPASEPKFSREIDPGRIRYSLKTKPNIAKQDSDNKKEDSGVQYSFSSDIDSGVRYSLDDSYDTESVTRLMSSFSKSTNPAAVLRGLENNTNRTFVDCLIEQINRKKLRDSTVYKAAQIDRRLFSKMISDRNYKPAKDTAVALIIALKLTLTEAVDMLSRAGYTLSHSSKRDIIIEYFIREQNSDLTAINEVLYRLDQKVIGR